MSRAGPRGLPKSYLDRTVPRACHPSVVLVYNGDLKGESWGMLVDFSGWTEKE